MDKIVADKDMWFILNTARDRRKVTHVEFDWMGAPEASLKSDIGQRQENEKEPSLK